MLSRHRKRVGVLFVLFLKVLHKYSFLLGIKVVKVKVLIFVLSPALIIVVIIWALAVHLLLDHSPLVIVLLINLFDLLRHGIDVVLLFLPIRTLVVLDVLAASEYLLFNIRVDAVLLIVRICPSFDLAFSVV